MHSAAGLSGPDADGFRTYTRPEGKSGGHGVGWSEIPRYQFKIPSGWEETAVSIADLGGTEIDLRCMPATIPPHNATPGQHPARMLLPQPPQHASVKVNFHVHRFTSPDQGSLAVVVAPVLRFADVGFNADVHIEELGPPDKLISGFAPELFGSPLSVRMDVPEHSLHACCAQGLPPRGMLVAFAYAARCMVCRGCWSCMWGMRNVPRAGLVSSTHQRNGYKWWCGARGGRTTT